VGNLSSQFDLALILAASKRFGMAVREYDRARERASRIGPLSRRGLLHVALIDLQRAVHAYPEVAAAPEVQGEVGSLKEDLEKARSEAAPLWAAIGYSAAGRSN
jgi:hypothetical protein